MIPKPMLSVEERVASQMSLLMSSYQKHGEKCIIQGYILHSFPDNYTKLRIKNLSDDNLIQNINWFKKYTDLKSKTFYEIFSDTLTKRRVLKINKIKERLNGTS